MGRILLILMLELLPLAAVGQQFSTDSTSAFKKRISFSHGWTAGTGFMHTTVSAPGLSTVGHSFYILGSELRIRAGQSSFGLLRVAHTGRSIAGHYTESVTTSAGVISGQTAFSVRQDVTTFGFWQAVGLGASKQLMLGVGAQLNYVGMNTVSIRPFAGSDQGNSDKINNAPYTAREYSLGAMASWRLIEKPTATVYLNLEANWGLTNMRTSAPGVTTLENLTQGSEIRSRSIMLSISASCGKWKPIQSLRSSLSEGIRTTSRHLVIFSGGTTLSSLRGNTGVEGVSGRITTAKWSYAYGLSYGQRFGSGYQWSIGLLEERKGEISEEVAFYFDSTLGRTVKGTQQQDLEYVYHTVPINVLWSVGDRHQLVYGVGVFVSLLSTQTKALRPGYPGFQGSVVDETEQNRRLDGGLSIELGYAYHINDQLSVGCRLSDRYGLLNIRSNLYDRTYMKTNTIGMMAYVTLQLGK